jgi:hypothetical protein
MQIALLQFFSVPLLVKTLFAHWHKDAVPYHGGSITDYLTTFAWNQISRVIGFIIRACTLVLWLIGEAIYLAMIVSIMLAFLFAPLFILVSVGTGFILLFS